MTSQNAVKWRSGGASDAGLIRTENEDRYWIDDEHGVFLVADGMGGHAAGELAAQTAVDVIREQLATLEGSAEDRVRCAITRANNRIFELSRESEYLRGMACVLTLALVDENQVTIGHVGDSRLYMIWNSTIRKLTSDHSPVGEVEDAGEMSQEEAMRHPRRNEVFRDVGSRRHMANDDEFIEIRSCQFKPDAAFLICSDGLTDQITSARIKEVVDRYDGDAALTAAELVRAANEAGGRDNITALLVAGPQFPGRGSKETAEIRIGDTVPLARSGWRAGLFSWRIALLVCGVLIGMLLWAVWYAPKG